MAILGYKNYSLCIRDFGLAEWLETHGLNGWLEIATDGLEAPAGQRIANEITAHYNEAVGIHMAAGESELSAQARALAELGDPQEAAANFQKSHLTTSEAKHLKWMEWTAAKPFFSLWTLVLDILPLAGFALLCSHAHWGLRIRLLAIPELVIYAGARFIPRLLSAKALPRRSFLKGLVLSNLLASMALVFAYALIIFMRDYDAFPAIFLMYIWGIFANPNFRIWKKLRKIVDERNELPSRQNTAS
jgi:hypothetical protein